MSAIDVSKSSDAKLHRVSGGAKELLVDQKPVIKSASDCIHSFHHDSAALTQS